MVTTYMLEYSIQSLAFKKRRNLSAVASVSFDFNHYDVTGTDEIALPSNPWRGAQTGEHAAGADGKQSSSWLITWTHMYSEYWTCMLTFSI